MKNIMIINGHQTYRSAEGKLNKTLTDNIVNVLSANHNVQTTIVQNGYSIEEEQRKFLWADIVKGSEQYGRGGLLTDKHYMFSTTWNAPAQAFNNPAQFFGGKSLEEALSHLHRTQDFIGMKPLKSFACYDVIKNPDIDRFVFELNTHLEEILPL